MNANAERVAAPAEEFIALASETAAAALKMIERTSSRLATS